ncbi:MAG: hypothetical protein IPK62_15520 [Bacteroidetes bacterium]|nr:hypothetical protein [Bacteroidota bacterium]
MCKLDNSQELFIAVQEAYEILSDSIKKKLYDEIRNPINTSENTKKSQAPNAKQYERWQTESRQNAENLAKEKYTDFKDSLFDNIGQAIGGGIDFLALIASFFFAAAPYIGMYTSYNSVVKWEFDEYNDNAIAGFIVCTILSVLFTILFVLRIKEELFHKK